MLVDVVLILRSGSVQREVSVPAPALPQGREPRPVVGHLRQPVANDRCNAVRWILIDSAVDPDRARAQRPVCPRHVHVELDAANGRLAQVGSLAEDQVASGTHSGVDHPVLELAEIAMQTRSDASGAKLSDIFEPHLRSGEPFLSELRVGAGDHVANAKLPVQLVECGSPERAIHSSSQRPFRTRVPCGCEARRKGGQRPRIATLVRPVAPAIESRSAFQEQPAGDVPLCRAVDPADLLRAAGLALEPDCQDLFEARSFDAAPVDARAQRHLMTGDAPACRPEYHFG